MRRMMAVLAVLTVVTLVGCSSSKKSSSTVAAGSNSSATTAASSGSSGSSGSSSNTAASQNLSNLKICNNGATNNLIARLQANAAAASASNNTNAMQTDLNLLKGYESDAPSAIRADVTTLVNFEAKFLGILSADKGNTQKLITDMQGIQTQSAQLQAASQHIQAWAIANCHA